MCGKWAVKGQRAGSSCSRSWRVGDLLICFWGTEGRDFLRCCRRCAVIFSMHKTRRFRKKPQRERSCLFITPSTSVAVMFLSIYLTLYAFALTSLITNKHKLTNTTSYQSISINHRIFLIQQGAFFFFFFLAGFVFQLHSAFTTSSIFII